MSPRVDREGPRLAWILATAAVALSVGLNAVQSSPDRIAAAMVRVLRDTPGAIGQLPAIATKLAGEEAAALGNANAQALKITQGTTGESLDSQQTMQVFFDIHGWFLARRPLTKEKVTQYLARYSRVDRKTIDQWRTEQAKSGFVGNSRTLTMSAIVFQDFLWNGGEWKDGQPAIALARLATLTKDAVTRWGETAKANGADVYGSWTLLGVDDLFANNVFQQARFDAAAPIADRLLATPAPPPSNTAKPPIAAATARPSPAVVAKPASAASDTRAAELAAAHRPGDPYSRVIDNNRDKGILQLDATAYGLLRTDLSEVSAKGWAQPWHDQLARLRASEGIVDVTAILYTRGFIVDNKVTRANLAKYVARLASIPLATFNGWHQLVSNRWSAGRLALSGLMASHDAMFDANGLLDAERAQLMFRRLQSLPQDAISTWASANTQKFIPQFDGQTAPYGWTGRQPDIDAAFELLRVEWLFDDTAFSSDAFAAALPGARALLAAPVSSTTATVQPPPPLPTVPTPSPTPSPSPKPAVVRVQDAVAAANQLFDPDARITALEQAARDFPDSTLPDTTLLSTLVAWADGPEAAERAFNRLIERIPPTANPQLRTLATVAAVDTLLPRRIALDRAIEVLESAISDQLSPVSKASVYDALGRVYLAKGDIPAAEAQFRLALGEGTGFVSAAKHLVAILKARGDLAGAESTLRTVFNPASPVYLPFPRLDLVDLYVTRGNYQAAETLLRDAFTTFKPGGVMTRMPVSFEFAALDMYLASGRVRDAERQLAEIQKQLPVPSAAVLAAARIAEARNRGTEALDVYLAAAARGELSSRDFARMDALYTKLRGSDSGLVADLDSAYRTQFPLLKVETTVGPPPAGDRLVVVESFTSSGCQPCAPSAHALAALADRYGNRVVVVSNQLSPPTAPPNPMAVSVTEARRVLHSFTSLPTTTVDGVVARATTPAAGTTAERAAVMLALFVARIDEALQKPARAAMTARATRSGDQIDVAVTVTKLPIDLSNARLHVILAERNVRFSGENGVRFHGTVTRAAAGARGLGLKVASDGTFLLAFNLGDVRRDLSAHLAADLERRRPSAPLGGFLAEGRAIPQLNASALEIIAFVQAADRSIIQAVRIPVGAAQPVWLQSRHLKMEVIRP